ncbi:MAG: peptide-methionine (S)-S-oxide reductase MsrA [Rubellimicrobium sp.]|nr:peptide-methionine (S)-S-oxide reductase MsrA [Rubellimicrobium sp.]
MPNAPDRKSTMVGAADALPGRPHPIPTAATHFVTGRALSPVPPAGMAVATFGMGCFWGVERKFWQAADLWLTMAGYAGGLTPNPTYEEVCSGLTGHAEVVRLIHDPARVSYDDLLRIFWENHDPTQGMRQGGDRGTQYRSAIYWDTAAQRDAALASRDAYATRLAGAGFGAITTEIAPAGPFYMAEDYHQQYLAKNPQGSCGIGGTGVTCPIGTGA